MVQIKKNPFCCTSSSCLESPLLAWRAAPFIFEEAPLSHFLASSATLLSHYSENSSTGALLPLVTQEISKHKPIICCCYVLIVSTLVRHAALKSVDARVAKDSFHNRCLSKSCVD